MLFIDGEDFKGIFMRKLGFVLLLGIIANNNVMAKENLPFIGTKVFNFAGGNGTENSITIQKNGTAKIVLHGTTGSEVLYKGKFSSSMMRKDGMGWLLKDGKIYATTKGKIDKDCGDGEQQCESTLD
jgi:hypothetical protein